MDSDEPIELSFQAEVFDAVARQSERDNDQDRRIAYLEAEVARLREFVDQMGAFSNAIAEAADRITGA